MNKHHLALALGITLLAGCASLPPLFQPPGIAVADGRAELRIQAGVTHGTYAAQGLDVGYTAADVDHVTLSLYRLDGTNEIPMTDASGSALVLGIPKANLGDPVVFSRLKANTTYRVKAEAYRTADQSERISVTGPASWVDVVVTRDDRPTVATLKVRLLGPEFNGQATASGITLTPGIVKDDGLTGLNGLGGVTVLAGAYPTKASGLQDGTWNTARFNRPGGVTIDASGNLYVADTYNHAIRKVTPAGVVTTLAGAYPTATAGFLDGDGASARFNTPVGIVLDASGTNLYVADSLNHAIRKVRISDGDTRTLAGAYSTATTGFTDGATSSAKFNTPRGLAIDPSGNLYVADGGNHAIRKVTSAGVVTTLAGSGTSGFTDAATSSAKFNSPAGVALDAAGNVYVADYLNHAIRKVTSAGVATTLAGSFPTVSAGNTNGTGTAAKFNQPWGLATDTSGNLYVADKNNSRIRKITPQAVVTTFVGGGSGYVNGIGSVAAFSSPEAIAFDTSGSLYVADALNHAIRKITP